MAVLPLWACMEFERLRRERDEARAERDRARDSACLYEQIIARLQGGPIPVGPMFPDGWAPHDLTRFGGYVVKGPR